MAARSIRLLHVEDDAVQRRLLQAHLGKLPDLNFAVTPAESEDEALEKLDKGFDLVLLDYHLSQGNGLNCLKRVRLSNAHIPVIAISGVATPEIAAELLEAGADDYFSKDSFETEVFSRSVRSALARADAWKARAPEVDARQMSDIVGALESICQDYATFAEKDIVKRLDRLEANARKSGLTFAQTMRIYENIAERLSRGKDSASYKRLLRPMLLELVLRLFDEGPAKA